MHTKAITIIGAGAWGTALAIRLALNGQAVHLWGQDRAQMHTMQQSHVNAMYLPNIVLPNNITIYLELNSALKVEGDILIAVPSHAFSEVVEKIKPYLDTERRIFWATKGLDHGRLLHHVAEEMLGERAYAILSGPSFAREVAEQKPTAVVIAGNNEIFIEDLIMAFHCPAFRVYKSHDMVGVEIGGAVKNVLAIATGISDGLQLGANARAALITRGLAEMTRLGLALGAEQNTFMGLACVGDLVLTCSDDQSRNRRFGLALGQGKSTEQAKAIAGVIEGIRTTDEVLQLAAHYQVEMPIAEQIEQILQQKITPQQAFDNLLARDATSE